MRIWLLVLVLALACSAHADGLTTRDGRPIRNVAVISRIGDYVVLFHAAMSVPIGTFRAEPRYLTLPDFGIDARVEKLLAASLTPALNIVPLKPGVADNDVASWDMSTVKGKISRFPPDDEIDAYIVVCNDDSLDEAGSTMLTIRGLGLYHRFRLFGYITAAFAVYRVMLVDARTGETIRDRESGMETGFLEPSLPWKKLDKSRWPGDETMLSPEQQILLREDLYGLVDESLVWTLKRMKLAR